MALVNNQDNSGGQQNDYLNTADTAGRPMALASLLFTLLIIAALALLLFTAGRWAYNKYIQNDEPVATTSEQEAAVNEEPESEQGTQSSGTTTESQESGTSSSQESTTNNTTESTNNSGSTTTTNNTGSGTTNNTSTTTTTPTTGATTPQTVPNTGPESLIGLFAVSVIAGAFAHNRWAASKR